jgi:predicted PurR-regulated permease PerM
VPDPEDQPADSARDAIAPPSTAREIAAIVALLLGVVWVAFALAPRDGDAAIPALVHPMVAVGLLFFLFPFRRRVASSRGVVAVLAVIVVWLAARMSIVWAPFVGAFVLTYLLRFLSAELQTIRLPGGRAIHLSSRTANYTILAAILGFLALSVFVIVPGFVAQVVQLVDGARVAYVRGLLYQSADVPVSDLESQVAGGGAPLLADPLEVTGGVVLASGAVVTVDMLTRLRAAGVERVPIQTEAYLVELYEEADWLRDFVEEGARSDGISKSVIDSSRTWLDAGIARLDDVFGAILGGTGQLLSGAVGFLATTVFTLIVLSYLIRSYDNYLGAALLLFPVTSWERIRHVASGVDESLQAFLRGQFIIVLAIAALSAAAYGLCGIPFALLMGVIGGLLNTIPNVGPALAGIVAAGALLVGAVTGLQPDILLFIEAPGIKGFFIRAMLIPVAIFTVQSVDNAFISPRVMSRAVSVDPLMILASVLLGGTIFGFWGVLLAIPGLVVVKAVWENWDAAPGTGPSPSAHAPQGPSDDEASALDDLF